MLHATKLMFAALGAVVLLAAAVGGASANNLSTNESRLRIVWRSLEFVSPSLPTVRCPVTLEGSFRSATIRKVIGATIGAINAVSQTPSLCTGGTATLLSERLPWELTYEAFMGTLPRIEKMKLLVIRPAFRVEAGGVSCLAAPPRMIVYWIGTAEAGGSFKAEGVTPESETFTCGFVTGHLEGSGTETKGGSTERILIRLI